MKLNGDSLSESKLAFVQKYLRSSVGQNAVEAPVISRRPPGEPAPLSFGQQQIWLHAQASETPFYNETMTVYRQGTLDVAVLERCLFEIIRRHEIWRTIFIVIEGEPAQVVQPIPREIPLAVIDLAEIPEAERHSEALRAATEDARRPFDLRRGPLLRFLLVSMGDQQHRLYVTLHHLIFDAVSAYRVFVPELAALYESFSADKRHLLTEPRIQYADFAHWQRKTFSSEALSKNMAYWHTQLAGDLPVCQWPNDRPRPPIQTHRGATQRFSLPGNLIHPLRTISQQAGVSLYMTLLAGLAALLYRYTGQDDIIIGSLTGERPQAELELVMGYFVNPLALRIDLSGSPTFRELQLRVRDVVLDGLDHAGVPFTHVVRESQRKHDPSRNPLFQIVLSQQPQFREIAPGWDLVTEEISNGGSKFDLLLVVDDRGDNVSGPITYNPDLFDASTVTRMVGHWCTLLTAVSRDPKMRIADLPILTEAERLQILVEWNQTERKYPAACVHELFEEQVGRIPDQIAVAYEDQQLSYSELNRRANQLARYLRKQGVGPDVLVGLCVERSQEMVVGLLGILKAGGAYVPLDPTYPRERLAFMLEDANVPVLLTQHRLVERLPECKAEIVCLDEISEQMEQECDDNVLSGATAENLAYVIYTSGSTGRPKGVCVIHRGVVRLVKETNYVELQEEDVFLQFVPVSFDVSTFEIWGCLLNGARLVVFPAHTPSLKELGLAIQHYRITTLWLTSALFHRMVDDQIESFSGVKQLLAGGDVLSVPQVKRFLETWPNCRLINGYGPTENTTFTCCYPMTSPQHVGHSVSIGRPIANTQVYILDGNLNPVPIGVSGEIFTGGAGLARGYLNRPELTAEKFIPNPFSAEPGARLYKTGDLGRYLADGNIEFLGRFDNQVKVRGFRIELGEIEAIVGQHPNVRESLVVAREQVPGEKQLIAYVVPSQKPAPTSVQLRAFLQEKLPDYMVPSAFVSLESLPLTPNGKIDRQGLPEPEFTRDMDSTFAEPRDGIERQLVLIWKEVLAVDRIGTRDNFFDLGGHSLLAARLFARLEERLGIRVPLSMLFRAPTIEALAEVIRENDRLPSWRSLVAIQPAGNRPPVFGVPGVGGNVLCYNDLARLMSPEQPFYALQSRGLDGTEKPLARIEDIATTFLEEIREVQPQGPYILVGACMGGVVAYEMAQQLHAKGQEVGLLILLETWLPVASSKWWRLRLDASKLAVLHLIVSRLRLYIQTLAKSPGLQRFVYLHERLTILKEMVAERDAFRGDRSELYLLRVMESNLFAFQRYQPRVYPGHVVLFRAEDRKLVSGHDRRLAWHRLAAGGLKIQSVPGGDSGLMLVEPHVQVLARKLKDCIQCAQPFAARVKST